MMWWNNGMGWGGWIVMTIAMVAFWALVVLGIVAMFRGLRGDDGTSRERRSPRDAEEILGERFARGEIDADEYHARQSVLRSNH